MELTTGCKMIDFIIKYGIHIPIIMTLVIQYFIMLALMGCGAIEHKSTLKYWSIPFIWLPFSIKLLIKNFRHLK